MWNFHAISLLKRLLCSQYFTATLLCMLLLFTIENVLFSKSLFPPRDLATKTPQWNVLIHKVQLFVCPKNLETKIISLISWNCLLCLALHRQLSYTTRKKGGEIEAEKAAKLHCGYWEMNRAIVYCDISFCNVSFGLHTHSHEKRRQRHKT